LYHIREGGCLFDRSGWCTLHRLLVFLGNNCHDLKKDTVVLNGLKKARFLLGIDAASVTVRRTCLRASTSSCTSLF
jgi:hypothetical protein